MSNEPQDEILRVKSTSSPASLASAIAYQIYDNKPAVLRAIGAGSVNQAVKAIAIARSFTAPRGFELNTQPSFATVQMPEGPVSAIVLRVTGTKA